MLLIFFLLTLLMGMSQPRVHPIILVPGDGGNSIEGRLNKTTTVHYICDKVSDWFTLWLNLEQLVPEVIAKHPSESLVLPTLYRWSTVGWTT